MKKKQISNPLHITPLMMSGSHGHDGHALNNSDAIVAYGLDHDNTFILIFRKILNLLTDLM